MKKIITAAVICMAAMQVQAQKTTLTTNVKLNLFSPIARTASGFVEQKVSESSTVQLGFYYTGFSGSDLKLRGFGITPEYRYYVGKKEAMNGFYVGSFLRYQQFKLSDKEDNAGKLSTYGGGFLIGNQWIFSKKVILDAFIGPSYNHGDVKVTSGQNEFDLPGGVNSFGVRTGVSIGIAF